MVGARQVVYLSLGSNIGDRKANLEQALQALEISGVLRRRVSSFFETEPVGFRDQPWFLNIALEAETDLSPTTLLECCQEIETAAGRFRAFRGAPRTLDLDILLYEDFILNQSCLVIPHPRMAERRFVLEPLAQIAPEIIHPVLGKSIRSLLASCPDTSAVRLYTGQLNSFA
jgi:2-amino-4-hydroxy-6-hydroxymethyldihydropteridine diphosphokinase